jgi:hypothetical protein
MEVNTPRATDLFLELCVSKEPHRFILEIPKQAELVHEMWIKREAAWQYQPQKPALTESKNTLARDVRPAEHNDLSIGSAIRVWNARYHTNNRMRERN